MKRALPWIVLMLAAPAAAQGVDTFDVTAENTEWAFPVGEATAIPVEVTVGCGILLENSGSLTVTLETDLPAAWGATGGNIDFSAGPACVDEPVGEVVEEGSITVTPTSEAVGLDKRSFTIYANATGASDTFDHTSNAWVEYVPGHTMDVDIDFPYTYTKEDDGAVEFNITITIEANADTMVMFENVRTPGSLNGFSGQQTFLLSEGDERTRVLSVTWMPPSSSWDNATISFFTYSHCLADDEACDMSNPGARNNAQNVTWTIQNAAGGGGGGSDKESPGLGLLVAPLVAAAALLARRRR